MLNNVQVQATPRFVDRKIVARNAKRWLWYPLDVIVPERKRQVTILSHGGDEVNSVCLQRYGRGFLPRGLPTLVESWPELMTKEQAANVGASEWEMVDEKGVVLQTHLMYVPSYPGDAVKSIISRSMNDQHGYRGHVELTALQNLEWEQAHTPEHDGILDLLEASMFGDGMEPTMRGLEEQIKHASYPANLVPMRDEMLMACQHATIWGNERLKIEHGLLKLGTKGDHTYAYSPLGELLLLQLEQPRQDQPFSELSRMIPEIGRSVASAINQPAATDYSALDARLARLEAAEQRIAQREAELVEKEAKLAQSTVATEPTCEGCGRVFGSTQAVTAHKPYCKGKPVDVAIEE